MEVNKYFTPGQYYLSPAKMRALLVAYNDVKLKFNETTDPALIAKELYKRATDTTVIDGNTNQAKFFQLLKLSEDELGIRTFIKDASDSGILRITKGAYKFNGVEIAPTFELLVKRLSKPEESLLYDQIADALEVKRKGK